MAHRTMQARRRAAQRAQQQHPPRPAPSWVGLPLIAFIWGVAALAFYYLAVSQPFWVPVACLTAFALVALVIPRSQLAIAPPLLILIPATILGVMELGWGFQLGGLDVPSLPAQERPAVPASAPPVPTTERVGREPAQTRPDGSGATEAAPPVVDTPKIGREAPTAAPPPVMDTPKEGREPIAPKQELAPAVIEAPKEGKAVPETVYLMAPAAEPEKVGKPAPETEKVGKEQRP